MVVIACVRVDDRSARTVLANADCCVVIDAVAVPVIIYRVASEDISVIGTHKCAVFLKVVDCSAAVDPCIRRGIPGAVLGHSARVQTLGNEIAAVHSGILSVFGVSGSRPLVSIRDRVVGVVGVLAVSIGLKTGSLHAVPALKVRCALTLQIRAVLCSCLIRGLFKHLLLDFRILKPCKISVCINNRDHFIVSAGFLLKNCRVIVAVSGDILCFLLSFCITFRHPLVDIYQDPAVLLLAGSYCVAGDQPCQLLGS